MSVHKFKTGDTVFFECSRNVPGGAYVIIRQLPQRNGECEYQIKSPREPLTFYLEGDLHLAEPPCFALFGEAHLSLLPAAAPPTGDKG